MISGDGKDKCYVWNLQKLSEAELAQKSEETKDTTKSKELYRAVQIAELKGHTETVEFCKLDGTGKWMVTGGMNNLLRVWDVANGFSLKQTIDQVPQEDLNFVEWHQTAPLLLTGGKDLMVWLVNAVNGKVMANFIGHEDEVVMAKFTQADGGKQIVSCSVDGSIRVWSPLQGECLKVIR